MQNGFTIEALLDALADKIAARVNSQSEQSGSISAVRPRLLTVEEAATYLGRTKSSIQHLISDGAIPIVRHDRRVFLDVRDLDNWIESAKS